MLREIKARFDMVPGLYLKSVEQKGAELTIKGESPNEGSVTRFGQSLEFSSGLFTELNIETQRDTAQVQTGDGKSVAADYPSMPKPEVVSFTVKCTYNPVKAAPPAQPGSGAAATHVAKN